MKHTTGTREEWLAARLELLQAEKDLTHKSDEIAERRQKLPWVRVEKDYRFETEGGTVKLADLFQGRSQLLVYHFMFGPEYTGGQNHPRWRNPEATDLLRRAARILDRSERRDLYYEFQEILAAESPAIPLVAVTHLDAYPADIRGFVPHPARQTNSWNCWEWH